MENAYGVNAPPYTLSKTADLNPTNGLNRKKAFQEILMMDTLFHERVLSDLL